MAGHSKVGQEWGRSVRLPGDGAVAVTRKKVAGLRKKI